MASLLGVGDVGSTGSIDDLIQAASTTPTTTTASGGGGTFRKVMGGLLGGAANIFMPGMGSVIGNIVGGGAGGVGGAGGSMNPAQMLQMQQQMGMEQAAFTTASTILKDRHDAAMEAIRNAKSS